LNKPSGATLTINFDLEIPRDGSNSVKHDGRAAYFGTADVLPMWVADMDFASPVAVTKALADRVGHPLYGYSFYPESAYNALINWLKKRHNWEVQREWIMMAPGVVPSLFASVMAFAKEGESVIVQPPVYFPFFSAVTTNHRRLIENPLRLVDEHYEIDFEHLEKCAADGARLMLFCSPHNPVGRVWSKQELSELLRITRRFDITIIADEIHADLIYPGERHITLSSLAGESDNVITTVAPSKTFNIPGLGLSSIITSNAAHRQALKQTFETLHATNTNPFSIAAFEAAYLGGEEWLDSLLIYLKGNRDFVNDFVSQHLLKIKTIPSQGTYLMWLDCRNLELTDVKLREFFVHKAKVGMNPGITFGRNGSGFMRLNIATPRHKLAEAMEKIKQALN
jgi:cystathionine beta-lyase